MKKSFYLFLFLFTSFLAQVQAQKGYDIKVTLQNYAEKELVFGFHFGEKQYVKDTVTISPDGSFYFKADTFMPCGVYLLVLKPDNSFVQLLMPDGDQKFSLTTDAKDPVNKMTVKGSDDNELFYDYMRFLNKMRPDADTLKAKLERVKSNKVDSLRIADDLAKMDKSVKKYQLDIMGKHPNTLTAKIIKAAYEPELPEFKETDEKELMRKKYYWVRAHFFDNLDIADPCLLRSPVLHQKIDHYVTKLTPQHPDSINIAIDYILDKQKNSPENFKYYLIHFLNYYAKSNVVGFDACYVHIVKKYYETGLAPWTKKEDLDKIIDNAHRLEPILIGKIAPNITVKSLDNKPVSLYDVDADYTVLFFWDPECGHCKKAAPFMVKFAQKYKDRGVKIFGVCTAVGEKGSECEKSVKEKEFNDFINVYDPYIQSKYKTIFDVRTTPQIFILNRQHEILVKRISGEQIDEVMEEVIKFQKEKNKG